MIRKTIISVFVLLSVAASVLPAPSMLPLSHIFLDLGDAPFTEVQRIAKLQAIFREIPSTQGENPRFANTTFIGISTNRPFTLAHELGHILTNTNDTLPNREFSRGILFPDNIAVDVNSASAPKRLPESHPGAEPTVESHNHVTARDAKTGAFIQQAMKAFNVCQAARTLKKAGASGTALGNFILQAN